MIGICFLLLSGCDTNKKNTGISTGEKEAEMDKTASNEIKEKDEITESNTIPVDSDKQEEDNMSEIKEKPDTAVNWEEKTITVYKPYSGGVWYPRMYQLKNGTLICGFDTNEDGNRAVVKIVSSVDGGLTWSKEAVQGTNYPEYDCANANFIELDNGDIWLAYRANVMEGEEYYSSIRINVSKDGGKTWEPHSIAAEEKGVGGVYEPQLGYIEDKIAVFYANDSLNVVKNGRQQNIEFKIWEGTSWGDKIIASDGTKTFSRDGMPVWCKLEDGSYAMVIESTSLHPSYEFIIQMKTSPDGIDWSNKLKDIYIPTGLKKKAGAPYIVKLADGRIAVSFQTDEDDINTGDAFSKMKVMISKDKTGTEFLPSSEPFDTPQGYCSNWNSLLSYDNYLYAVTSTNYPDDSILLRRGTVK